MGFYRAAKGYIQKIERTAPQDWKVTCMSGVGLLDNKMHRGGMYHGATFGEIFTDIVGDTFKTRYQTETGYVVWGVRVYGWLPYDTARNNLHKLLFATGAVLEPKMERNTQYDYEVMFLTDAYGSIPPSQIMLGSTSTIQAPATGVEVTEHSFSELNSDPVETVFDNSTSDAVDHKMITFAEPMHSTYESVTEGLTVNEWHCNYAIVTGMGTLTAKKVTHSKTIIAVGDTTSQDANIKKVENNCLVTVFNSQNVAQRVLDYYSATKNIKAKVVFPSGGSRVGDAFNLTDSIYGNLRGYLTRMEFTPTTLHGAQCELLSGYIPSHNGNNYNNRTLITSPNTVFTVPTGVTILRMVLIGGGQGGQGGTHGHFGAGDYPPIFGSPTEGQMSLVVAPLSPAIPGYPDLKMAYYYYTGNQPTVPGGKAGKAGAQGKIYVITLQVREGQTFSVLQIGQRGLGGAAADNSAEHGVDGTWSETPDTIVQWSGDGKNYSSGNGVQSDTGYYDEYSQATFALPGADGVPGGDGGTVNNTPEFDRLGINGYPGGKAATWNGANGGYGKAVQKLIAGDSVYVTWKATGGGGGGAAYGNRPSSAGGNAYYDDPGGSTIRYLNSGKGGPGADADTPADKAGQYGCGGDGGNGGGSGGNVGGAKVIYWPNEYGDDIPILLGISTDPVTHQVLGPEGYHGGLPGEGSRGGHAGQGCAIFYY